MRYGGEVIYSNPVSGFAPGHHSRQQQDTAGQTRHWGSLPVVGGADSTTKPILSYQVYWDSYRQRSLTAAKGGGAPERKRPPYGGWRVSGARGCFDRRMIRRKRRESNPYVLPRQCFLVPSPLIAFILDFLARPSSVPRGAIYRAGVHVAPHVQYMLAIIPRRTNGQGPLRRRADHGGCPPTTRLANDGWRHKEHMQAVHRKGREASWSSRRGRYGSALLAEIGRIGGRRNACS